MNERSITGTMRVLAAIGAVVAAIVALIELPTVPRFEYAPANYAVAIVLSFAVPCLLLWLSWALLAKGKWWGWTLGFATSLVSILLFVLACFVSLVAVDTRYEAVGVLQSEHAVYRVYRTNGGPATSFGIVLRRERSFVPGLKLVTVIRNFDPASDATFERLPSGLFRLTVAPYGQGDNGQVFEFKPDS